MSTENKIQKTSYSARLIEYLESNGISKKTVVLIRTFANNEKERIDKLREETKNKFTWGKYKDKDIKEVFKLDEQYCLWAGKSSYLREEHKELIAELIQSKDNIPI